MLTGSADWSPLSDNGRLLREQMIGIINRPDTYGNTPLHYAKSYPDQSIVKLLLSCGAKIDVNPQGKQKLSICIYTNMV